MMRSSSRSSLCLGAQPTDSRDTLQYQEAGRQDSVILSRRTVVREQRRPALNSLL